MGCSGVLWDVPGVFRAFPGCSGGVPGVFRGVPGVFRGVPGFTDTQNIPGMCVLTNHMRDLVIAENEWVLSHGIELF